VLKDLKNCIITCLPAHCCTVVKVHEWFFDPDRTWDQVIYLPIYIVLLKKKIFSFGSYDVN